MAKILIVEDSDDLRGRLRSAFAQRGHEVLEARSGNEALDLLANQAVQAILSAVEMPDGDGLSLLAWIRAHSAHLPFYLLGHPPAASPETVRATAIMPEPARLDVVLSTVEQGVHNSDTVRA